jgi:hypothetical protein
VAFGLLKKALFARLQDATPTPQARILPIFVGETQVRYGATRSMLGDTKLAFAIPAFVEHPHTRLAIRHLNDIQGVGSVRALALLAKAWTEANVISSKYCVERDAELWSGPELWPLRLL